MVFGKLTGGARPALKGQPSVFDRISGDPGHDENVIELSDRPVSWPPEGHIVGQFLGVLHDSLLIIRLIEPINHRSQEVIYTFKWKVSINDFRKNLDKNEARS